MRTIKFLEDRHFTRTGEDFKAGTEYTLADDQAARWVRRNAAVYVVAGMDLAAGPDQTAVATIKNKGGEAVLADIAVVEAQSGPSVVDAGESQSKESGDGVNLERAADLATQNSGSAGQRAVNVKPGSKPRQAGKNTGNRNK